MAYSQQRLTQIWQSTDGRCDHCVRPLRLKSYGQLAEHDGWEVDHSRARAQGGSDHLNNLRPACISCNRSKRAGSSRAQRLKNGIRHPPLSAARKSRRRKGSAVSGAVVGGLVGGLLGPVGAAVGAALGGVIGHEANPEGDMRIDKKRRRRPSRRR